MKTFRKNKLNIAIAALSLMFVGCTTTGINKADNQINDDSSMVSSMMRQGEKMTPSATSVSIVDDIYVAGNAFKMSDKDTLPPYFKSLVEINKLDPMSFQEIIGHLSFNLNVKIDLSADAVDYLLNGGDASSKQGRPQLSNEDSIESLINYGSSNSAGSELKFSMVAYHGTVSGLLDSITGKANLFWKWDGNHVTIHRVETNHYVFDGDATEELFDATISSSRNYGDNNDAGSKDSSTTAQNTKITRKSGNSFADMDKALSSMISKEGKFSISTQQGLITVTDTPLIQNKVARYIEQINGIVNKRINVRTEVYEIVSDDNGNFGIDWNAVYNGSSRLGFNFKNSNSGSAVPNVELGIIASNNNFNGSKAFVSALNKVANMSLVTSSTAFTTNGKVVPVQVADEVSYLKSMSLQTDNAGRQTVSLEPGSILSGYTMSLTPRINSDGDVDMQFAIDMSQLKALNTLNVGESSMIQLPDRSFKNFEQRVSVNSGSTIMLAGFERTENSASVDSVGGKKFWLAGGKKTGGKKKIMTMILITPYVMAR
jgi:type IVB pilus formation R64 PilN family outer membrane protein